MSQASIAKAASLPEFERVIAMHSGSMGRALNLWWKYSRDLALSGFEAQRVITLRLMKLAAGGPAATVEARRMVVEKWRASAEAAATLVSGGAPPKVLKRYRAIMRSNERRLKRGKR